MAPRRKVSVSKTPTAPSAPKRGRGGSPSRGRSSMARGGASSVRGGASTSQGPPRSEARSKQRHDIEGNIPAPMPTREESQSDDEEETEDEEVQSELPVKYFGSIAKRTFFYKNYAKRALHDPKTVDFLYMTRHKLRIEEWLTYQGWVDLLREENPHYPMLVKIFHANFSQDELTSYVKGVVIEFGDTLEKAFEQLGVILGVPYMEDPLPEGVGIKYILNNLTNSNDHTARTNVIKASAMNAEARILRLILANCILPKSGSRDSVTQKEAEIIWKIMHHIKVNLPKEIFTHIIACNKDRSNIVLPYSSWLTGVFRFFGVDLRNENAVPLGKRAVIGQTSLKLMGIDVLALQVQREDEERAARQAGERDAAAERAEEDPVPEAAHGEGEDSHPSAGPEAYSFQRRDPTFSVPDVGETSVPVPPSQPDIMTFLKSLESSIHSEFQTIHTVLESLSAQQTLILHRQDTLEAQIASLSSTSHPPPPPSSPPPPPSAPSEAPLA